MIQAGDAEKGGEERYVLERIRELMSQGSLKAGDKLPSERQLSEQFGVSRGYVRKGLQRLEFYGLVKTLPHRGTVVERIGGKALSGIIQGIVEIEDESDIDSLMETRAILERQAARLAALRSDEHGRSSILEAHLQFLQVAESGQDTLEVDHLFHLAIARFCGNGVTLSLLSIMTPKIIEMNRGFDVADTVRSRRTYAEHQAIVDGILAGDADASDAAMALHMERARGRRIGG